MTDFCTLGSHNNALAPCEAADKSFEVGSIQGASGVASE